MAKTKLGWKEIWEELDDWCQVRAAAMMKENRCDKCGNVEDTYPDWDKQMKAIQRIVERHIRRG